MKISNKFVFVLVRDIDCEPGEELAVFSCDDFSLSKLEIFFSDICELPESVKPSEFEIKSLFDEHFVNMGWGYFNLMKFKIL